MRVFGGDRLGMIMDRMRVDEDTPIENRIVSKTLESAQKRVEGFNFDSRKNVVQYDDVMNRHRLATYSTRRKLLLDTDISEQIHKFINDEAERLAALPGLDDSYEQQIKDIFPFDEKTLDRLFDADADKFTTILKQETKSLYEKHEKMFSHEIMREIERDIYLQILDNLWMQHLENMDHLREGIRWYGVGQRDPLVEYRRQSQLLYDDMSARLRFDVVRHLFHARPVTQKRARPTS